MLNRANNHSYLIAHSVPETLVGTILQIVETAGMSETQEQAIKSLIKEKIYDILLRYSPVISDELDNEIREAANFYSKENPASMVDVTAMSKQLAVTIDEDVHAVLAIYDWNKMSDKTKGDILVWLEAQQETLQLPDPNIANNYTARLIKTTK